MTTMATFKGSPLLSHWLCHQSSIVYDRCGRGLCGKVFNSGGGVGKGKRNEWTPCKFAQPNSPPVFFKVGKFLLNECNF